MEDSQRVTSENIESIFNACDWTFAKTMAATPHAYTLKRKMNPRLFENVVVFMRENSVEEKFYNTTFKYFYSGDYKYWTMGAPLKDTILINRCKKENKYE